MRLDQYLEMLYNDEAAGMGFAIDSFSLPRKKKKKVVFKNYYPEQYQLESGKLRAMIDFDGPIHKYSKGHGDGDIYDEPSEGVKESIEWLKDQGYEIVIFTTRASKTNSEEFGSDYKKEIVKIENWLESYGIPYDLVTAEKLAANFYIDDKAIHYGGSWDVVKDEITKRMNTLGG
jgi:hypothetical protein